MKKKEDQSIKTIEEFESAVMESMKAMFGNCARRKGVLRSLAEHLGVADTGVIVEAAFEAGLDPDVPYPILHFHTTLATDIDEELIPGVLKGLNDLNTVISAGSYPAFGCFGFYAPLRQIYLTYRMPVNAYVLEAEYSNVMLYLSSLQESLDLFADFILFLSSTGHQITLEAYMDFLDVVADMNDLEKRLDYLDQFLKESEEKDKKEQQTD
ncbi:MAG: hypothetical protein K5697_12640 [Lachnospiraceae bacterium]|nr:hypothetical protein [Lachnospiraceae bacterium]